MLKTVFAATAMLAGTASVWAVGIPCDRLAKLQLPHTEITGATLVAAGAFIPPANPNAPRPNPAENGNTGGPANPTGQQARAVAAYKALPAFCRVQAVVKPTADSDIEFEVWMPVDGWTGRLEEIGNGGYGSNLTFGGLAEGVAQGYIATANNTGHDGNDGSFAIGHPEKYADWGYRAVHENVVAAKAIAAAFYGNAPKYSYWNGCSTGGRQGWIAAEYYPNDFDGLAIGDAANPMSRLQAGTIWENLAVNATPESYISIDEWQMIHKRVMDQCDALDGLKDGVIDDPRKCNFAVETLLCKSRTGADCLTSPQLEALKKVIAGPRLSSGEQVYPGFPVGDPSLPGPILGKKPEQVAIDTMRALFQDPNWDYHSLNLDKDIPRNDKIAGHLIDALDYTKLQGVFNHGGKVLYYHGWNDGSIAPQSAIDYYEKVVESNGGLKKTYDDVRLFMIPGGNHCGGGEGPNVFNKLAVISDWVEHGKAPDAIIASHLAQNGQVDRTRPLCPYPQVAKYKGIGSIEEAQNFACTKP